MKNAWELPRKKGSGWLRANVKFPNQVIKDDSIGRYRECNRTTEVCIHVPSMFYAVWYDARDDGFFTFEDGDYLTLSSGGGTLNRLHSCSFQDF